MGNLDRSISSVRRFALGQKVRIAITGRVLTDDMRESLHASDFVVCRLYPASSAGFEYRIKNIATGQERMAIERDLLAAES